MCINGNESSQNVNIYDLKKKNTSASKSVFFIENSEPYAAELKVNIKVEVQVNADAISSILYFNF